MFAVTRWKTITALIPGRSKKQCWNRWQYALDPSIVQMTERTGRWLKEEDERLAAVQYIGTIARTGMQLLILFLVERNDSVWIDGTSLSLGQKLVLKTRRLGTLFYI
jgi:hypothetical protein